MKRVLLLAALVCACQAPNPLPAPSPTAAGVRGGTLVIGDYEWPATLDPEKATMETELRLAGLLYQPLWTFDPQLKPVPRLLAAMPSPKVAKDGSMTLDLRLRAGLRWSDGSPLTADDVISATGAARIPVAGLVRRSATEVVWRFASQDPGWRLYGPRVIPERPGAVSGPFQVAGQVPGGEIELTANPYASPRPWLDAITIRVFDGKAAEISALQTGEVDLGFHLLPSDLPQLEQVPRSRPLTAPTLRYELLLAKPGQSVPPIDRDALNAAVFQGTASLLDPLERLPPPVPGIARGASLELLAACEDQVRQEEQAELARQWGAAGASVRPACEPRAGYFARLGRGDFQVALFSYDFPPGAGQEVPSLPGSVYFLYRWPQAVQVTGRLHQFQLNPVAGLDTWNAADWWLAP